MRTCCLLTRVVTNNLGNSLDFFEYNSFGDYQNVSSTNFEFQFAGLFYHARSALGLTPYRAYKSNLGIWISRDLISRINPFNYVEQNPVGKIDPLGLQGMPIGGNNCLGYAMGDNRSESTPYGTFEQPTDQTFSDFLRSRGWNCTPLKKGDICEPSCDEQVFVLQFSEPLLGGNFEPFSMATGSSIQNGVCGYHAVGYNVPIDPSAGKGLTGWSDIEGHSETSTRPQSNNDHYQYDDSRISHRYCCKKKN